MDRLLIIGGACAEAIMIDQQTNEWKTKTNLAIATASAEILKLAETAKGKLNELVVNLYFSQCSP